MRCCELFSLYKKLKYIKKLKMVEKFNEMLCSVKKYCAKLNKTHLLVNNAKCDINLNVDIKKLRYIQCYGIPEDGCFDSELLKEF